MSRTLTFPWNKHWCRVINLIGLRSVYISGQIHTIHLLSPHMHFVYKCPHRNKRKGYSDTWNLWSRVFYVHACLLVLWPTYVVVMASPLLYQHRCHCIRSQIKVVQCVSGLNTSPFDSAWFCWFLAPCHFCWLGRQSTPFSGEGSMSNPHSTVIARLARVVGKRAKGSGRKLLEQPQHSSWHSKRPTMGRDRGRVFCRGSIDTRAVFASNSQTETRKH